MFKVISINRIDEAASVFRIVHQEMTRFHCIQFGNTKKEDILKKNRSISQSRIQLDNICFKLPTHCYISKWLVLLMGQYCSL